MTLRAIFFRPAAFDPCVNVLKVSVCQLPTYRHGGFNKNGKPMGNRVAEMNGLALVPSNIGKSCIYTRKCSR